MIHMKNIEIMTAKSATYLGNVGLNLTTETGGNANARISFIDPLIDLASRSFRIRAELENSEGAHSPGTTCTLYN
jgi:multidrug efflux pump subunit AcrA (membrane-fusion protein)